MVKVLSLWRDYSDMVRMNALYYQEKALGKKMELKIARDHRSVRERLGRARKNLNETVETIMPDADWVILSGMGFNPPKKRDYKIALFLADIHCARSLKLSPQELCKYLNKKTFDAYLMHYTKLAYQAIPTFKPIEHDYYLTHLKGPKLHFAPALDPSYSYPSDKPKKYDVAFLARAHEYVHALRYKIMTGLPKLARNNGWKVIIRERPPGRTGQRSIKKMLKKGYIVGQKYNETLARSKAFIFGLGLFKYPALKFVEGMSTRTCVFSDPPLTAKSLHYIPDWNFVRINGSNWRRKLKYYLRHDEEREEIAENGYQTFMKYHTVDVRAGQLARFLEKHK